MAPRTHWHYVTVLPEESGPISPEIGAETDLTEPAARAVVGRMLDKLAEGHAALRKVAAAWKDGAPIAAIGGDAFLTVYRCGGGKTDEEGNFRPYSCEQGYNEWARGFAEKARQRGIKFDFAPALPGTLGDDVAWPKPEAAVASIIGDTTRDDADRPEADLHTGVAGQFIVSSWAGETPVGTEEAYLLLTTPGTREHDPRTTMPIIADAIGATVGAPRPIEPDKARVVLGDDIWLEVLGERYPLPESVEFRRLAGEHWRVILAVGFPPLPDGMDGITYIDTVAQPGDVAIGFAPVVKR